MFQRFLQQIFYLSKQDKKTMQEKVMKITEELGELAEAVLSYTGSHGCVYKGKTKLDIIEEIGDVVTVALSLLSVVYNDDLSEDAYKGVEECWLRKLWKWENKIKARGNETSARILLHDTGVSDGEGKLTNTYGGEAKEIPACEKLAGTSFGTATCWFTEPRCESCPRGLA